MELTLDRRRMRGALACLYGLVGAISLALLLYKLQKGSPLPVLGWLFNVDSEKNIPTWMSSIGLFLCAQLLCAIGLMKRRENDRFSFQWLLMAVIFMILSMDEVSGIHENVDRRLEGLMHLSWVFYYAWVIPAAILVIAFVAYYFRFLMSLSPPHRRRFIISGAVYVSGALGADAVSGHFIDSAGYESASYEFLGHIEEFMEMAGVVCFVDALLAYLGDYSGKTGARLLVADVGRGAP